MDVRVSTRRHQQTHTSDQQIARVPDQVAAQPGGHLATEHIYRDATTAIAERGVPAPVWIGGVIAPR